MQRLLLWVGLVVLGWPMALGVVACDRRASAPTGKRSPGVASQVVEDLGPATEAEIREAQTKQALQGQVEKLEMDLSVLDLRVSQLESEDATVSTEQDVYGVARTKFGPFVISSGGVTPYLDGFKVKLSIGNLTNATFHGTKLKVTWGPPIPSWDSSNSKERAKAWKARKSQTLDLTTMLYPGQYSRAEVTLTPAKPEEVKSLEVGLELNVLSLRR